MQSERATPGPWEVRGGKLMGPDEVIVCDPFGANPQDEGLLIAAPELLRRLKDYHHHDEYCGCPRNPCATELLIAKAEGRDA